MPSSVRSNSPSQQEPKCIPTEDISQCVNSVSSLSNSSNGGSFFDAFRASSNSGIDTGRKPCAGNEIYESLDSRMAAHMAMFFPPSYEFRVPRPSWHGPETASYRHFPSDNYLGSTTEVNMGETLPNRKFKSRICEEGCQPRKVASLNDVDDLSRAPNWPANVRSPVSPTVPRYPPPIRSPTPPGLPSFGTREAVSCVSQLASPAPIINSNLQRPPSAANSEPTPYASILRRLFGLTSSATSCPRNQQAPSTTIRAEDGTAVLGRFPYRQSGHGMNVARRLDDHPFHRRHFSLAQCDGVKAVDPHLAPCRPANGDQYTGKCLPSLPHSTLNPEQFPETYPQSAPGSCPQAPAPMPTFIPRGRVDSFHTCSSGMQEVGVQRHLNDPESPDTSAEDPSVCFLAPTQSAAANSIELHQSSSWLHFFKTISSLYCCCRSKREAGSNNMTNSNTPSSDTYITARPWNSTSSAAGNPMQSSISDNLDQSR